MNSHQSEQQLSSHQFHATKQGSRGIGIRNRILVLPSVICSQLVSDRIADQVLDTVSAPHDHGCAQLGADNEQTRQTLIGVGQNPNVAGTVVVGLGCEEVQSADIATSLDDAGVPVQELSIQEIGGTDECIERGVEFAETLRNERINTDSQPATLGDLTIGIVSSDLRESTRTVASPLIGDFVDEVIDAGGRVLVGGTERLVPYREDILNQESQAVSEDLERVLDQYRDLPSKNRHIRADAANSSFEDVTRIHGSHQISEVIEYGESPSFETGLGLLNSPSRVEEATTGFAAAGAHLVIHATADGIPTGHPILPVIKVTGNAETYAALTDDLDIDAADGTATDLLTIVIDVANGKQTCSEQHGLSEFAISRIGPSM